MFLTPDRFDRRRDPQPDEDDEQHREHRIVAGVDEVSDVEPQQTAIVARPARR